MTALTKEGLRRQRRAEGRGRIVAFSVSYEAENLLRRGLGLEHLRDLMTRIARPLLRSGLNLAYGGNWKKADDNFTYFLLDLINAELDDRDGRDSVTGTKLDMLYNHSSWPNYLEITPAIEAQWVRCCRIVRIDQEMAGIDKPERIDDSRPSLRTSQRKLNAARTASAMRQLMMKEIPITHPAGVKVEKIPPVEARVALGGKLTDYAGFMPGIFEEALATMQAGKPLYILGGFGGASEVLAKAILEPDGKWDKLLTIEGQTKANDKLANLLTSARAPVRQEVARLYENLRTKVADARLEPEVVLKTGLSRSQTCDLMLSSSISLVTRLTRDGMKVSLNLPSLSP